MVVCALPLPLVAIPMALTPPPHDPAKRNTSDDQDPGAVGHLLTRLAALRTVAPLTLPLTAKAHKNLQQSWRGAHEPDTAKACTCRIIAIGR